MIQSILVPVDGSPFAEQAIPVATGLAGRLGAQLEFALVRDSLTVVSTLNVGAFALPSNARLPSEELEPEARSRAAYLHQLGKQVASVTDVPVRVTLLSGPVIETLAEHANERADLVVMTTHARGVFSRFWLGSVADGLVRELKKPLLLIKPSDTGGPSDVASNGANAGRFRRVLVPLDNSPASESILKPLVDLLASEAHVTCTLLLARTAVFPAPMPLPGVGPIGTAAMNNPAVDAKSLNRVAKSMIQHFRVETRVAVGGDPASVILAEAERIGAELIAMATHGRGGLRRLVLGSVADKVMRRAGATVLLFRPTEHSKIAPRLEKR
jgi:nucleotide-binding universal stress UspA family protein